MAKPTKVLTKMMLDFFELVFVATGVIVITYFYVAKIMLVTGNSMVPTMQDGDQLLSERVTLKIRAPERGEVLVIEHPQHPGVSVVKRLIGMPEDRVKLENGYVYINGTPLEERYLSSQGNTPAGKFLPENSEVTLPADSYFFLGDNRTDSLDSREWGPVKKGSVKGRAVAVYYPLKRAHFVNTWTYGK